MSGNLAITGYAIVSDDDKIAGADGMTPVSLRNEKDWELYQRAQELADLVVFARRSHELEPNIHGTLRLVVSREAAGLEQRPDSWWWDPRATTWEEVAARLLPNGGLVAVGGGQVVFDLFLMIGFDGFHLSRAHGINLPGGRSVFLRLRRRRHSRERARTAWSQAQRTNPPRPGAWRRNDRLAASALNLGRPRSSHSADGLVYATAPACALPAGRLNGVITCTCDGVGGGPCGKTRWACITTRQAERTSKRRS